MTDNRNREFIRRHIGPSIEEQKQMLSYLGFNSLDEFIKKLFLKKSLKTNLLILMSLFQNMKRLINLNKLLVKIKFLKALLEWVITEPIRQMSS